MLLTWGSTLKLRSINGISETLLVKKTTRSRAEGNMAKAINIIELGPEAKKQLEGILPLIPEKWEVYAKVFLLIYGLNSLADAKWVINRIRRELDNMGKP